MSTAAAAAPRVGYGDAFGSRQFRALFAAQVLTVGGGSVTAVALTILVFRRTDSPFLASLTFAIGFLPFVLGAGISGLVDRVRPRRLVSMCDAANAGVALLLAVPGMPVPALLALLFGSGLLGSLATGSAGALIRSTVADAAYVPARSLMKIAGQTAQIGGNAVGGALVVALGTSGTILTEACACVAAASLIRFAISDYPTFAEPAAANLLRDSLAGARALLRHAEVAPLLLLGWLVPLFSVAPEALAAPYVTAHHGSPALVGWWLTALPAGIIVGDVAGVRYLRASIQQRLVLPVAAAGFVPYLVFVFHPPVAVGIALLVVSGLAGMYSLGLDGRLRDATPPHLFARMMALYSAGLMTLQGLGFALAGAVAQGVGSGAAIAIAGVCGLVVVLLIAVGGRRGRP